MEILETHGNCPYCGRLILSYHPSARPYGSPIQRCKSCNGDYLDRRFREAAVDGIPEIEFSPKKGLFAMGFGAVGFVIVLIKYLLETRLGGYYYTSDIVLMGLCGLITVLGIADIIRVKTGSKTKEFAGYKAESEARLNDPDYAELLKSLGYNVPSEFLKETE